MGEVTRRTREGYDAAAEEYHERFKHTLRDNPLDRTMIDVFADLVGEGEILDAGCGPGHVTGHLHDRGAAVRGVDLSPEMVALARRLHPGIGFAVGELSALDAEDGSVDGLISRSSVIHTPPEELPGVFAEFHRVLAPGGLLLLCFQAHVDTSRLAWPFDHAVAPAYRLSVGRVADLLGESGFEEVARQITAPAEDPVRGFHYANLLARKPREA